MTYDAVMAELKARRNAQVNKDNAKRGAGDNQFGVTTTALRAMAKQIETDPELADALWKSGNVDAMLLAANSIPPPSIRNRLAAPCSKTDAGGRGDELCTPALPATEAFSTWQNRAAQFITPAIQARLTSPSFLPT